MRAMLLEAPHQPLRLAELPIPQPGAGQVLLKVHACGVCHTDLHILDGELTKPKLPLVLGHQIVATVAACEPVIGFRSLGPLRCVSGVLREDFGSLFYDSTGLRENLVEASFDLKRSPPHGV
jgi:NADPH:quinone reductase-like Zn-dependent oxidoreductase